MTTTLRTTGGLGRDAQKSARLLEALEPFLKRFLILNHDLNNSLGGILGHAECLLVEGDLSPAQRDSAERIVLSADRMKALLEELSDLKTAMRENEDLKELLNRLRRESDD